MSQVPVEGIDTEFDSANHFASAPKHAVRSRYRLVSRVKSAALGQSVPTLLSEHL